MKTSWKLMNILGIDIELHLSFILFLLIFVILDLNFLFVLLMLFTFIVLHELSHSLVARSAGIQVKKIILLPFGGMAAMEEAQLEPYAEFKMAIAGPLFNYAVCALVLAVVWALGLPNMLTLSDWELASRGALAVPLMTVFISSAFWLNWVLGSMNLFIPAIPLDGGRVLRSALAMVTDYVNATRIATIVSTVITFFLFVWALLTVDIILLVISIFIYLGATAELEYALSNKLLSHFPLSRLVRKSYVVLPPRMPLDKAIEQMITTRSLVVFTKPGKDFDVVSLYDIRHVPKPKWKKTTLAAIATKTGYVEAHEPLTAVLNVMRRYNLEAMPVLRKGKLAGVVFRDDIDRIFEILKVSRG